MRVALPRVPRALRMPTLLTMQVCRAHGSVKHHKQQSLTCLRMHAVCADVDARRMHRIHRCTAIFWHARSDCSANCFRREENGALRYNIADAVTHKCRDEQRAIPRVVRKRHPAAAASLKARRRRTPRSCAAWRRRRHSTAASASGRSAAGKRFERARSHVHVLTVARISREKSVMY